MTAGPGSATGHIKLPAAPALSCSGSRWLAGSCAEGAQPSLKNTDYANGESDMVSYGANQNEIHTKQDVPVESLE
jgi:hypothetical protein